MNLVEYVFNAADRLGRWKETAILYQDQQVSYETLYKKVRQCGALLRQLGVEPGDRIGVVAQDCPEFIVAFLGAISARVLPALLSTMLAPGDLEYILGSCGARAVLLTPDQLERFQSVRRNLDAATLLLTAGASTGALNFNEAVAECSTTEIAAADDVDPAFILYTSGTTGKPKGAVHRHGNLPCTVESYCRQILNVQPGDRLFSSSRLFFAYGLGNGLSFPLSSGASVILSGERPSPPIIGEMFQRFRPTLFFGVPAVFRALAEYVASGNTLETHSLRFCVSAGEQLPAQTFNRWKQITGLTILDGIGSTEMLHMFMSNRLDFVRPGSSGLPVQGYEIKLVDSAGSEVKDAGSGHLMVKGPSVCSGYWGDAEKTAALLQQGWLRTGDVYRRDQEGVYWFEGRSDDLFKVKGMWVSPIEIEETLLSCPEVLEAAVVARADADGANMVIAYVVPKGHQPGSKELALRLKVQLAATLPRYKCPQDILFKDQLPRTATGKLQRFKLRS